MSKFPVKQSPTRTLRTAPTIPTREYSPVHRAAIQALMLAAEQEDLPIYVSGLSQTSGKKLKFYLPDEVVEDYLSVYDDALAEAVRIAEEVFGSQIARTVAAHIVAVARQEQPGASETAKPAPTPKRGRKAP